MKDIEKWFRDNLDCYKIDIYSGSLNAISDYVKYLVVSPHSGNDYRWLLKVSTVAAFDRWANSTAIEEFFDTKENLIEYLTDNQADIYRQLVEYLSKEYEDLEELYEILGE